MPFRRRIQYQGIAPPPVQVGQFGFGSVASVEAAGLEQTIQIQFQAKTEPVFFTPPDVTNQNEDKWHRGWAEPVRQRIAPLLAVALIAASGSFSPPVQPPQFGVNSASWFRPLSEPVRQKTGLATYLQQSDTGLPQPISVETITVDKWFRPLSQPVRQKTGLSFYLQQTDTGLLQPITAVTPTGGIPSTVSVGVQYETRFQYQGIAQPAFTPVAETITPDKWIYPWSEPVRHKPGLRASLQQAFIAPVLNDQQLTDTFESRWHQPWSEPVRQKPGLGAYLQHNSIQTVLEPNTQIIGQFESRWHQGWSEPVRTRPQIPAGEQQFLAQGAISVVELVNADKWIYPWSEPVRHKTGLRSYLQQALIAPVLNPETQITGQFESRWHYAWSEPVRFKAFPASEQKALAFVAIPPPEVITQDKWYRPWSEPVRTRQIATALQPSFAAPAEVIAAPPPAGGIPSTVSVGVQYETRFQYQGATQPVFTPPTETITPDKWIYAWSEPIRQKPGLLAALQQALIAPVLNPETQIIQGFESRWHYPWSEPVRTRQLATAHQQAQIQGNLTPLEFITEDKWHFAWTEPVRDRAGLRAYLQQALVAPVLNDKQLTDTFESRWHEPWSEPVRIVSRATALLPPPSIAPVTPEVITLDKWFSPWREPVRVKAQLPAGEQQFQQFAIGKPLVSFSYYNWLSEPVRPKKGIGYWLQQSFTADTVVIPTTKIPGWLYPWSDPVRSKPGLAAWLQRAATPEVPVYPNLPTNLPWFDWLSEPVRLRPGVAPALQAFLFPSPAPLVNVVTLTLSATEINSDRARFGLMVYNRPSKVYVSIREIPAIRNVAASIEEEQAIRNAAVSIEGKDC